MKRSARFMVLALLAAAGQTLAADVAVSNYSWLQIPDGIVAGVGNPSTPFNTSGYTGHLSVEHFRWGGRCWIPDGTLTADGAGDYWAAIQLDQPRNVKQIRLQYWTGEGAQIRRFRIEGSADGTSFVSIGLYQYDDFTVGDSVVLTIPVTNDTYRVVRVRMNGTTSQPGNPDYLPGTSPGSRGGPGFWLVEPFGDGTVADSKVNYANQPVFSTTTTCGSGLTFSWNAFNNGTLEDGNRVGEQMPWASGRYFQLDLGTARRIFRSILVSDDDWGAATATFSYSTDGSTFVPVTDLSLPIIRASRDRGALEYTFTPVEARYWRVTGATGSGYTLFNQWMLYQTINHPPVAIATNITVYVGVNGAQIGPDDVDAGSYDPDDDPITRTVDPETFSYLDMEQGTATVTFTVSDGEMQSSTNITVTLLLDPALEGRVPVSNYNWLQLRPDRVTASVGLIGGTEIWAGYGATADIRWGNHVWIPSGGNGYGTYGGASNYYAAVTLDQRRHVSRVDVQWWAYEGTSLTRYYVDGSINGTEWAQIGSFNSGSARTGVFRDSVTVTAGEYLCVRVRIMAGDYAYGSVNRGGPGVFSIEPVGFGSLPAAEVNWAHKGNFLTTVANNALDSYGVLYNDGRFFDGDGDRVGTISRDFGPTSYIQIDLGALRWIDTVVILWDGWYWASTFKVRWSANGTDFQEVPRPVGPSLANGRSILTFRSVQARYVRLTDCVGTPHALFNQMLVLGGLPPPPVGSVVLVR